MHFKQNNKESKSYVQGLRSFGNTLPRGIKGILKKSGYNYSEIISKWNLLVGKEISNCSYFLKSVLELIKPKVVATLGGTALDSLNLILGKKFKLSETVAKPQRLDSFILLPLYHPSPRVTNWKRPLSKQKQDYKKILPLL